MIAAATIKRVVRVKSKCCSFWKFQVYRLFLLDCRASTAVFISYTSGYSASLKTHTGLNRYAVVDIATVVWA